MIKEAFAYACAVVVALAILFTTAMIFGIAIGVVIRTAGWLAG